MKLSKEAIYLAVGIRENGSKEVLAYTIAPTESAYVWNELLHDIRAREPYIGLIRRLFINEKLDFDTAKILISEFKKLKGNNKS